MLRVLLRLVALAVVLGIAYLLTWPVPVAPVAWSPSASPGFTGPFAANTRLAALDRIPAGTDHGPEDIAIDDSGRVYASMESGYILRLSAAGDSAQRWVHTGGRPVGMDFDAAGNLIVADALRGLLSVSREGVVRTLVTEVDGVPLGLADDVDVAADGRIWFTDATTKFSPRQYGLERASLLDIMEHGAHGRLIVLDPATGRTRTVLPRLQFANGVTLSHDERSVLVNETGAYRVVRVPTDSAWHGKPEVLIDNLPGFPDNISRGMDGRYWIALISPRNALLDRLGPSPFARRVVQRLPAAVRPKAAAYGHVLAIDDGGRVVADLQDPAGTFPQNTSVTESATHLWIGSLVAPALGRVAKQAVGLAGGP